MTPQELKAARETHGLDQTEFACLLNTTQQRISNWERATRRISPYIEQSVAFFLELPEAKQHEAKKTARAKARTVKKKRQKARHERYERDKLKKHQ